MNINRHNYEEFFLLYVDNELTAGQRKIVEAFVAANPDLKGEFELMQQATFTDDVKLDQSFINSLLKPVADESSISEEQLLLYVDGELRADQKAAVEKELIANSDLQKELLWLRRSQLTADASIVFPDKSLLYKQAEPARIFSLSASARRWSAAAAVVVLLGSAMWLLLEDTKTTDKPVSFAAINQPSVKENKTTTPLSPKELVKEALDEQTNEFKQATAAAEATEQTSTVMTTNPSVATVNPTEKTSTATTPVVDEQIDPVTTAEVGKTAENNFDTNSNIPQTSTVQPIANNISYASYNNDVAEEDEDALLTEERQRRSGIAGLIKKAKRTFERKTGIQSSSSEVRFAVFAVNTQ